MSNESEDWIEDLKKKQKERQNEETAHADKRKLIGENVSGLWRVFRDYLKSESERYSREIGEVKLQVVGGASSEFSVNTVGRYPAVHLKVECCGRDGRQFNYTYTVRKNYDVENQESAGRFIIDANGEDVFLRTPEGIPYHDPKEAATLLLRGVVDTERYR